MGNKQWSVSWPDKGELARMVDVGMTHKEIAEQVGVTRQAVSMKLAEHGITKQVRRLSHAEYLPWEMAAEDHNDAIAHAMRAYSKQQQGGDLTAREASQVERLFTFMERYDVVLSYDHRRGFFFKPRDPKLDRVGDPVRRPA